MFDQGLNDSLYLSEHQVRLKSELSGTNKIGSEDKGKIGGRHSVDLAAKTESAQEVHEILEKGTIGKRKTLQHRAQFVQKFLFALLLYSHQSLIKLVCE